MKIREFLLAVLLLAQIAVCVLSQKEMPTGSLVQMLLLILAASLFFWLKNAPAVRDREYAERRAELYLGHFNFLKLSKKGIKQTAKSNVKAGMIFAGIFSAIAIAAFIILLLVYVINNFLYIAYNFIKASSIMGAIIFIAGCVLLIRNAVKKHRGFSKDNITFTGLVIENMLFSMLMFVY